MWILLITQTKILVYCKNIDGTKIREAAREATPIQKEKPKQEISKFENWTQKDGEQGENGIIPET